jgi:aminoglycoside phosphotransferase
VNRLATGLALIIATTVPYAGLSLAEDPPASDVSVEKDLTAVIALQGLPCGQVVTVKQLGDSDYIATCQDGNRYHVFLNADGRVIAEKQ